MTSTFFSKSSKGTSKDTATETWRTRVPRLAAYTATLAATGLGVATACSSYLPSSVASSLPSLWTTGAIGGAGLIALGLSYAGLEDKWTSAAETRRKDRQRRDDALWAGVVRDTHSYAGEKSTDKSQVSGASGLSGDTSDGGESSTRQEEIDAAADAEWTRRSAIATSLEREDDALRAEHEAIMSMPSGEVEAKKARSTVWMEKTQKLEQRKKAFRA